MYLRKVLLAVLVLASFICTPAIALQFDVNGVYFSDTFAPTGATSSSVFTNYDVRLGFNVDRKEKFYIGWNYSGISATQTTTAGTDQYASTGMGPSFLWAIDKDKTWILSFAYNLSSVATYTPASTGTPEKWKGTTMKAYLGYNFAIGEGMYFGPTITYYSASFNEKIVNETTYTTDANTRTQIYPALYFGWRH